MAITTIKHATADNTRSCPVRASKSGIVPSHESMSQTGTTKELQVGSEAKGASDTGSLAGSRLSPMGRRLVFAICALAGFTLISSTSERPFLLALNGLTRQSALRDFLFRAPTEWSLLSGVLLVAAIWYCWFSAPSEPRRGTILVGAVAACLAGVVSRLLQLALPSHPRPLHDPTLALHMPFGIRPDLLNHWSSFPSDTVALFAGLATVVYVADRRLGRIACIFVAFLGFCRVYLGFHSFTDIGGGATLGVFFVAISQLPPLARAGAWAMRFERWSPGAFYATFFFVTYCAANAFWDFRSLVSEARRILAGGQS